MNIGCVIQARMGSSRLPGKVLKIIGNKSVLDIIYMRLEKCLPNVDNIIFAIPDSKKDFELEKYLNEKKYLYFKGNENDVLSRYYECAKKYRLDFIVRITCDCPIIDYNIVNFVVNKGLETSCDYIIVENLPIGTTAEAFTMSAIENAHKNAKENYQREHVISYFLDNPNIFNNLILNAEECLFRPNYRLTLDTEQDYNLIKEIYNNFNYDYLVDLKDVINYLDTNKNLLEINNDVRQKSYQEYL